VAVWAGQATTNAAGHGGINWLRFKHPTEETQFKLEPIKRRVRLRITKTTASITAYSAIFLVVRLAKT
jgi:hypothetical protein